MTFQKYPLFMTCVSRCLVFVMLQLSFSTHAHSADVNEPIKKFYEHFKDNYGPSVLDAYSNAINEYFLVSYSDFLASFDSAVRVLDDMENQLQKDAEEFESVQRYIEEDLGKTERLAVPIRYTVDRINLLASRSRTAHNDIVALQKRWQDRCDNPVRARMASIFNPKALFAADIESIFRVPPSQASPYTVGGSATFSSDGRMVGGGGIDYGTDGMIITTMTAIGSAIPVIGTLIGFIAGVVVVFVKNWIVADRNRNEYQEYVDKIDKVALDARGAVVNRSEAIIRRACFTNMPGDSKSGWFEGNEEAEWNSTVKANPGLLALGNQLKSLVKISEGVANRISAKANAMNQYYAGLHDRYLLFLETLSRTYYPKLEARYLEELKNQAAVLLRTDREAIRYSQETLFPSLKEWQKVDSKGSLQAIWAEQKLLDRLLEADTRFNPENGFFEFNDRTGAWKVTHKKIVSEVLK